MTTRPERSLLIIFLIILVNLLGFGIIIPLLPLYATSMGASAFTVGLLFASFSIAQLIAAPVLGDLSDRYGRRPVLIFSLLGTVASFAMLALARTVPALFAARIIDGLSGGNISTARAYIGDVTTAENRARGFGLIGAAFGLGFIFGPAMGGALSHIGYAAPAWGAAVIAAVATALTWVLLPETVPQAVPAAGGSNGATISVSPGEVRSSAWREVPRMLRHPVLGRLLAVDFLYWFTFAVYQTTFALFGARRFNFGVPQTGYLLAFLGLIGVIVQLVLVGRVARRFGERRMLVAGLVLAGAGLAAASFIDQVVYFVLALLPAALGTALAIPAITSLISQTARPQEQGRVQGVSSALEGLGRALGPLWGNGLLGFYGEGTAFLTAACVMGLTGLLAARGPRRGARPAPQRTTS